MITFNIERLADGCLWESVELNQDHYDEVGLAGFNLPLNVDRDEYLQLEQMGYALTIVARDEGKMVGYSILIAKPHIQHKDFTFAYADVFYLKPSHRTGRTVLRFINYIEETLKRYNIDYVQLAVPVTNDYSRLLKHLDYGEQETIYVKELTKEKD